MSDLCRQCTKEIWGEDRSDFVLESSNADNQTAYVLCEGCGYILVNSAGSCIDPTCKVHGKSNKQIIRGIDGEAIIVEKHGD